MLTLNDYYNLIKVGFDALKRDINDAIIYTNQEQQKLNESQSQVETNSTENEQESDDTKRGE